MRTTIVSIHFHLAALAERGLDHIRDTRARWADAGSRAPGLGERGQSTAEYALVLLGAATVALVFIAWASKTNRIGKLFDSVIDTVIGKV